VHDRGLLPAKPIGQIQVLSPSDVWVYKVCWCATMHTVQRHHCRSLERWWCLLYVLSETKTIIRLKCVCPCVYVFISVCPCTCECRMCVSYAHAHARTHALTRAPQWHIHNNYSNNTHTLYDRWASWTYSWHVTTRSLYSGLPYPTFIPMSLPFQRATYAVALSLTGIIKNEEKESTRTHDVENKNRLHSLHSYH
jgi:hypothetical protein